MRGNAVQPEPFRTNGSRARLQDKWQPSAVESLISLGFAALSATLVEPETQVPDDCETAWRGASPTLLMMMFITIRWRLKLEGETENMGVCTKERKGAKERPPVPLPHSLSFSKDFFDDIF